jgi:rsbT antagonist protein RsbS
MAAVAIVQVRDTLIVTIPEEIRDNDALDLQADLGARLERVGASGVVIDLTVVKTLDSFLGRLLNDIARQSRLLGAETVVVGMQPAVAITLVELGLELRGIHTSLSVDRGISLLGRLATRDGGKRTRGR